MAMLTSGEYALCDENVINERKSMLFVKLTDSAQRALNDYLNNMKDCEVPSIEFNKNQGRILIPSSPKENDVDTGKRMIQFKFDVISNMAMQGMQGRFECVQYKRGNKQLLTCGQLTQRLRIHANEDVYETTKNRMAAIELEQRKNCTRQLDWNSATNMKHKAKLERFSKQSPITPSAIKNEEKDSRYSSTIAAVAMSEISNMIRSKSRPVHNAPPQRPNSNACKVRKPLKERVIHMLAVKPYKITELYNVLNQEGIRDCDKSSLTEVLKSVTTVQDNLYHLAKHAWNDVQEDWLFYSDYEKQSARKNKLRNLTSPSSSSDSGISTSSNRSPNATSTEDISPSITYKRPGYINGVDGFPTKRQRISHFSRQETGSSNNSSTLSSQGTEESVPKVVTPSPSPTLEESQRSQTPASMDSIPVDISYFSHPKDVPAVVISSPEVSSTSNGVEEYCSKIKGLGCAKSPPSSDRNKQCALTLKQTRSTVAVADAGEKPKYLREYVTITNREQRQKYKSDFHVIFEEYQRLHAEVDSVSNMFAHMGESLRQHTKGSPKYKKIEADIIKKYYVLKRSQKFQSAKRRFEYLHEKLSHIKKLVHEYDEKCLNECESTER